MPKYLAWLEKGILKVVRDRGKSLEYGIPWSIEAKTKKEAIAKTEELERKKLDVPI